MRELLSLTRNNCKKSIGTFISFGIILIISAILFSSAVSIVLDVQSNFDKKYKEMKTANVYVTIPSLEYNNRLLEKIKNLKDVKYAEKRNGVLLSVEVGTGDEKIERNQIFYNINDTHKLNSVKILEETNENVENPLYLPYYVYLNDSYKIKDKYIVKVGEKDLSFTVKGYLEEMQYGDYSFSMIGMYLTDNSYDYLLNNAKENETTVISVETDNAKNVFNDITKLLTEENINVLSKNYDELAKESRLIVSNIINMILFAFSLIVLLISLLVSKFKIENSIEEDMTSMGVLKSLGYTNKQIMYGIMLPYIFTGIIGAVLGVALSYLLIPLLAKSISIQSGFIWDYGFNLLAFIITLLITTVLVWLFAYRAARRIKKLNPINAIRGIKNNDKPNGNHVEVEKTKGNINFILSLKNFVNGLKQNILLGIVLFFLTILSSFAIVLFYNINVNPLNFINLLSEEHPSVIVSTDTDFRDEFMKMDNVKNVIYYSEEGSAVIEDLSYPALIAENFDNLSNDLCYEGTNPKTDNEVTIGSAISEKYNLAINDTLTLKKDNISYDYKIVRTYTIS